MSDPANARCPRCGSRDTAFNRKKGRWFCQDCEAPFETAARASSGRALAEPPVRPLRIFFSYGHDQHRELVDRLRESLERRGHRVWIDYKEIGTWQDWKGRITEGIYDSELTVAFLSTHAMRNPGVCRNEIALALDRHAGRVYPVLLEPAAEVMPPVTIAHLQWQDLTDWRAVRARPPGGGGFDAWFEDKLQQMLDVLEGEGRRFQGDIDVLRAVLQPLTFSSDIVRHVNRFVGRDWVFAEYERWLDGAAGSRLLWLTGNPGSGKSAIAAMLAHTRQASVFGAWFCSFSSVDRRNPSRAARTLAFQLAARWPDYRRKLMFKLAVTEKISPESTAALALRLDGKSAPDLFDLLLAEPLVDLIWREGRQVVLIDGLDELTDSAGRNPILDLIVGHLSRLPEWMGLLITSRRQAELRSGLAGFRQYDLGAMPELNRRDLATYIRGALGHLGGADGRQPTAKLAEVEADLLDRSEGMILYVEQALTALKEGVLALDNLAAVPGGLHGLYRSRMQHLYPTPPDSERVRPLLRLLAGAPGALPPELARDILEWPRELLVDERARLGSYLVETATGGLRLFHGTFGEWLRAEDNQGFYVDADDGSRRIAEHLWARFKASGHDFFYAGVHAEQLLEWLPRLIDHLELDATVDGLIDTYLEQTRGLDLRSGHRPALLRARRHLRFGRDLIAAAAARGADWRPEPRLAAMADRARATGPSDPDGLGSHEYGLLRYLCRQRGLTPGALADISRSIDWFASHQPYWRFVAVGLAEIYLDDTASPLDALETGILGAHDDGRISALHQLVREYRSALAEELGRDFAGIDARLDGLAARLEEQGNWDDWAEKVQSLKAALREPHDPGER